MVSAALGVASMVGLLVAGVLDVDGGWGQVNVVPSLAVLLGLAALATGVVAYRSGERSFVVWLGLVPGVLCLLLLVAELTIME